MSKCKSCDGSGFVESCNSHPEMKQVSPCPDCGPNAIKAEKEYVSGREDALREIEETINGEREELYGKAIDNFTKIAGGWSLILDQEVKPAHVALMMTWLKIARLTKTIDHDDSWVDGGAYMVLGYEVSQYIQKLNEQSEAQQ